VVLTAPLNEATGVKCIALNSISTNDIQMAVIVLVKFVEFVAALDPLFAT